MENPKAIPSIHDKLFKAVFGTGQTVADFVQHFLSAELAALLNLDALALDPTNYISPALAESFSDVVYRTVWKDSAIPVAVVLLFEHKSVPDAKIYEQLLNYMLAIWAKDRAENRPLTFIMPIVIYQGKARWIKKPFSASFRALTPQKELFIPRFDYILVSVQKTSDEKLLPLSSVSTLGAYMLILKKATDLDYFVKNVAQLFRFREDHPERQGILNTFVQYLYRVVPMPAAELTQLFEKKLSPEMKEHVLNDFETFTQELEARGEARGEAKGKAEGEALTLRKNIERLLLKKLLSEIQIADGLEVPLELVYEIRDGLILDGRLEKI